LRTNKKDLPNYLVSLSFKLKRVAVYALAIMKLEQQEIAVIFLITALLTVSLVDYFY